MIMTKIRAKWVDGAGNGPTAREMGPAVPGSGAGGTDGEI